jgi:hypothetical protein
MVAKTEGLPLVPLTPRLEVAAPPPPTVIVYAVDKLTDKAASIAAPPPDNLGLETPALEV